MVWNHLRKEFTERRGKGSVLKHEEPQHLGIRCKENNYKRVLKRSSHTHKKNRAATFLQWCHESGPEHVLVPRTGHLDTVGLLNFLPWEKEQAIRWWNITKDVSTKKIPEPCGKLEQKDVSMNEITERLRRFYVETTVAYKFFSNYWQDPQL